MNTITTLPTPETPGLDAPGNPRDRLHLKLLMIFHYVVGGVALGGGVHMLVTSSAFLIMGGMMGDPSWRAAPYGNDPYAMQDFSSTMNTIMTVYMLVLGVFAIMAVVAGPISIVVGRRLRDRRSYGFLRAWSIWQWILLFPWGIPLGICLRNVLKRETVYHLFAQQEPWAL